MKSSSGIGMEGLRVKVTKSPELFDCKSSEE